MAKAEATLPPPGMKRVTIFGVWTTVDQYGYSGSVVGYFRTRAEAKAAATGQGWHGGEGRVEPIPALEDGDKDVWLLRQTEPVPGPKLDMDWLLARTRIRDKALKKLTPEEIRALGIED